MKEQFPSPTVTAMGRIALSWALAGLAWPGSANAVDDPMIRADVDAGYACFGEDRRFHGVYGGVEGAFLFDGFWALRGGYAFAEHRSKGVAFRVHQASLGVRYQLDVFEYVPWLDVSGVAFGSAGTDDPGLGAGVAFGFGFDRLLNENWSLGFAGRYHQVFGYSAFPAYLTLGARLGYRWVIGDPLAP